MATSPRSAPGSPSPEARSGGRLHIHGIKEMPAGYDAEVAELFRDLRAASGMSETDLAAQLATRLEVVQALEQGAIYALPPWPETCRVVSTYGTLLNLDVRPLLRRIYAQVEAGIVELAPKPLPDVPFMTPPQDGMRDMRTGSRPQGQPMAEPFPAAPRAPSPQPRAPQPMLDGRPPQQGQQARAPQPRRQPQDFSQGAAPRAMVPPPPQQRPPQPAPDMRVRSQPQVAPRALPQPQAKAAKAKAQSVRAAPKPQPKKRRGLLKWGIAALLASAAAFGLWMWMSYPGLFGSGPAAQSGGEGSPPAATADPNDPRSRKADRLPGPPS